MCLIYPRTHHWHWHQRHSCSKVSIKATIGVRLCACLNDPPSRQLADRLIRLRSRQIKLENVTRVFASVFINAAADADDFRRSCSLPRHGGSMFPQTADVAADRFRETLVFRPRGRLDVIKPDLIRDVLSVVSSSHQQDLIGGNWREGMAVYRSRRTVVG